MTKNSTRPLPLGEKSFKYIKKTILLLSFGGAGLYLLLSLIYQALIANIGTGSPLVYIFSYAMQAISVCLHFCVAGVIIFTFIANLRYAHHFCMLMHILSELAITVLLTAGLTWLTAYLDGLLRLPFSLSNFTLAYLEDSAQFLMIVSMSFLSVLSIFATIHVSVFLVRFIRGKDSEGRELKTAEQLVDIENPRSTLAISCTVTAAVFALFSIGFEITDTVKQATDFEPRYITEYLELIIPYFLLVIYILAGYFTMQYFLRYFIKKLGAIEQKK